MEINVQTTYKKEGIGQWITVGFCVAFCFLATSTFEFNKLLIHELWIIWFVSLFVFDLQRITNILLRKNYILLYSFSVFYFLSSSIAVGAGTSVNRVVELFEIASPIIMYDYYIKGSKKLKVFLLLSLLVIIIVNVVELIMAMNTYGLGLRLAHQDEDNYLKNAYSWAYSWVLITVTASFYIFGKKGLLKENYFVGMLIITIALLGCYIVFNSFFMTAIVCLLIGLILSWTYGKKQWIMKTVIFSLIGLLVFSSFYFTIIGYLGNSDNDTQAVLQRVEEIYNITEGNVGGASDFSLRNNLTSNSLTTFFKNPLFGINHEIKNFYSVQYKLVGDHSEWIDNLALYGLFSIFLFLFLIKSAKYSLPSIYFVFLLYLFMGFVNPVWYFPINLCLFFFIPLSYIILIGESDKTIVVLRAKIKS